MAAFEAEMSARTPKASREHARELDERAMAGEGTPEEALGSLEILWPAYFADPQNPPPMPPISISIPAYSGIMSEVAATSDRVAASWQQPGCHTESWPAGPARCHGVRPPARPPSYRQARF